MKSISILNYTENKFTPLGASKKQLVFKEVVIKTEISTTLSVPEWQKQLIRERVEDAKNNPNVMLDWENVKDTF